jgi:hypothetical protein
VLDVVAAVVLVLVALAIAGYAAYVVRRLYTGQD